MKGRMSSNASLDAGCRCVRNEALASKCPVSGRHVLVGIGEVADVAQVT